MTLRTFVIFAQGATLGAVLCALAFLADLHRHGGWADAPFAQQELQRFVEALPEAPAELPGPWRDQARICVWPAPPWADELPGGVRFPFLSDEFIDEDRCARLGKHQRCSAFTYQARGKARPDGTYEPGETFYIDAVVQRPCQ